MRHRLPAILLLLLALILAIPLATAVGSAPIPLGSLFRILASPLGLAPPAPQRDVLIVLSIRLPRILTAVLVGASLALAGATLQGLFRNPLVSPEILGISSGGSLGAVLAITLGLFARSGIALPACTVTGAFASSLLIYTLSTRSGSTSLLFIVLAGMAVSSFFNGLISAILLFAREHEIGQFLFWTMGGLEGRRWEHLATSAPMLLAGMVLLLLFGRELNLLLMGEEQAHGLGMRVERVKRILLGLAALLTGISVSISGTIGFVGLLVPHLMRLLFGPDHRILLPVSALGGGLFLLVCDTLGRSLFAPLEIRAGVVTALLGAPYLLYLLVDLQLRRGRERNG